MTQKQINTIITDAFKIDRPELIKEILSYKALDFTLEYLTELPIEKLRHIWTGAKITSINS